MHTSDAYAALVKELEAVSALATADLVALAGKPSVERFVAVAGEPVALELVVAWRDDRHDAIRITGHARGPSTWHHEHLQESVVVKLTSSPIDSDP